MTQPIENISKEADSSVDLHPLLANRWSPRAFAADPIDDETLTALLEAARWAPSSRNQQPWRFVVTRKEDGASYDRLLQGLMDGNREWAQHAPLLILVIAARRDSRGNQNRVALYDVGGAVAHLTLQAMAHDLYAHQMGGIYRDRLRELFDIDDDHEPVVALAIGYRGDLQQLSEQRQQQELAERQRKPLQQLLWDISSNGAIETA